MKTETPKQSVKRKAALALFCTIIATTLSLNAAKAAIVSDLKGDWSDAANPNGLWAYNQGASLLPGVPDWAPGGFRTTQPAWAPSANSGNFLPAWMKLTSTVSSEMQLGDIVVHTTDGSNGGLNGAANVTWTSPIDGTADFSGAVWMGRDIGRSNHWRLTVGGITVSEGDIAAGDIYDRALPFDLANGTGGAAALQSVPVSIGTVVALQIEKTSSSGDYVGVNLHVQAAVPEPATATLLLIGLGGICVRRCRIS